MVDGRPEFHVRACRTMQDAEVVEITLRQALDDGFTECSVCRPTSGGSGATPDATGSETDVPAADSTDNGTGDHSGNHSDTPSDTPSGTGDSPEPAAAGGGAAVLTKAEPETDVRQVWVADGFPEFHVEGCEELAGLQSVAVPYEQAIEDGFQPCVVCNPDGLPPAAAAAAAAPAAASGELTEVWVVDGKPDYHRPECERLQGEDGVAVPYRQAVEDGFSACSACRPDAASAGRPDHRAPGSAEANDTVEVVDGFPYYHRRDCSVVADLPAVTVPRSQAHEDGFTPCAVCVPDGAPDSGSALAQRPDETATTTPVRPDRQVWVVDEHPDYHVETCVELERLGGGEPIPLGQATEDGFSACSVCRPGVEPSADGSAHFAATADAGATAATPAGGASPGDREASGPQVWVVDGLPDYHLPGCARLEGMDEEPVPYEQAVEDGFTPCSVCAPDTGQRAAAEAGDDDRVPADSATPGPDSESCVGGGVVRRAAGGAGRVRARAGLSDHRLRAAGGGRARRRVTGRGITRARAGAAGRTAGRCVAGARAGIGAAGRGAAGARGACPARGADGDSGRGAGRDAGAGSGRGAAGVRGRRSPAVPQRGLLDHQGSLGRGDAEGPGRGRRLPALLALPALGSAAR